MTEGTSAGGKERMLVETVPAAWNTNLEAVVCEYCNWRSLAEQGSSQRRCPNCHSKGLSVLPGRLSEMPYAPIPELVLPFQLQQAELAKAVQTFRENVPFSPDGLNL
jgi:hypothetical protein